MSESLTPSTEPEAIKATDLKPVEIQGKKRYQGPDGRLVSEADANAAFDTARDEFLQRALTDITPESGHFDIRALAKETGATREADWYASLGQRAVESVQSDAAKRATELEKQKDFDPRYADMPEEKAARFKHADEVNAGLREARAKKEEKATLDSKAHSRVVQARLAELRQDLKALKLNEEDYSQRKAEFDESLAPERKRLEKLRDLTEEEFSRMGVRELKDLSGDSTADTLFAAQKSARKAQESAEAELELLEAQSSSSHKSERKVLDSMRVELDERRANVRKPSVAEPTGTSVDLSSLPPKVDSTAANKEALAGFRRGEDAAENRRARLLARQDELGDQMDRMLSPGEGGIKLDREAFDKLEAEWQVIEGQLSQMPEDPGSESTASQLELTTGKTNKSRPMGDAPRLKEWWDTGTGVNTEPTSLDGEAPILTTLEDERARIGQRMAELRRIGEEAGSLSPEEAEEYNGLWAKMNQRDDTWAASNLGEAPASTQTPVSAHSEDQVDFSTWAAKAENPAGDDLGFDPALFEEFDQAAASQAATEESRANGLRGKLAAAFAIVSNPSTAVEKFRLSPDAIASLKEIIASTRERTTSAALHTKNAWSRAVTRFKKAKELFKDEEGNLDKRRVIAGMAVGSVATIGLGLVYLKVTGDSSNLGDAVGDAVGRRANNADSANADALGDMFDPANSPDFADVINPPAGEGILDPANSQDFGEVLETVATDIGGETTAPVTEVNNAASSVASTAMEALNGSGLPANSIVEVPQGGELENLVQNAYGLTDGQSHQAVELARSALTEVDGIGPNLWIESPGDLDLSSARTALDAAVEQVRAS